MREYTVRVNDIKVVIYGNGTALDIQYPDGTSTFLQGDDTTEVMDMIELSDRAAYSLLCEYAPE